MIIVCEPQCIGFEHSQVNAALLAVIKSAFPTERVLFLAESTHLESVQVITAAHSIGPIEFSPVTCPASGLTYIQRLPGDWSLAKEVFDTAEDLGAKRILFSSVGSSGLWCIKMLIRLHRRVQVTVIPHSILETIFKRPSFKPRDLPFWFRNCLAFWNLPRIHYLLLGKSIEKQLISIMPNIQNYISSIDHPYFYKLNPEINNSFEGTIRFGSIGVGSRSKGTDIFFRLATEVHENTSIGASEFVLIGYITDASIIELLTPAIIIPSQNEPLTRQEFEKLAAMIDYAVFCYPSNSYKLTASGAFFDALSFVKPLITLRNPFFEYYFEGMGDIGYLCENYEEMKEIIIKITNEKPSERYKQQCVNILAGRELLNIHNLANQFKKVWEA